VKLALNKCGLHVIFDVFLMEAYDLVKVFSATKAADREALGGKATAWLHEHADWNVVRTVVAQSSDASFHCLTLVFFLKRQ
jgi:hypothetical protein